ncbi:MAG: hypothetical protein KAS02_01420 [Candidatus Pacebacteria bacterium]|nr:hypothetical protein [Candidatus Paceibacterota bacterium]
MYKNLWNKKLLVVLGVVFLFLIIFTIFNYYKNSKLEYISPTENIITTKITEEIIQKDSDNDGLKDWEEILWETDPNNPDTDDDGMNDNDEILNERDPLVKGVGDINKIISKKEESLQTTQTTLTQTDILAREIFMSYVALKQNDALGTQEQEDLIQSITFDKLNFEPELNYISLNDLNIIKDSSQESLQKYATELNQILSKNPELRDDNIILKEALDNDSPKILEEIKSNIIFYEKFIDDLVKTETPVVLQDKHLILINLLKKMIVNSSQLTQVFEDPVLALIGAKQYYETVEEIINISAEIGEFFKQNNINF